ncbi:hypothetical protein COOONC_25649 [Cooperia oncophora]
MKSCVKYAKRQFSTTITWLIQTGLPMWRSSQAPRHHGKKSVVRIDTEIAMNAAIEAAEIAVMRVVGTAETVVTQALEAVVRLAIVVHVSHQNRHALSPLTETSMRSQLIELMSCS